MCSIYDLYKQNTNDGIADGEVDDGSGHVRGNISKDGGIRGRCGLFSR